MVERDDDRPSVGTPRSSSGPVRKDAKGFSSEIMIVKGDKEANAKSSMKIMSLGAK